jgi:hypothetical protein
MFFAPFKTCEKNLLYLFMSVFFMASWRYRNRSLLDDLRTAVGQQADNLEGKNVFQKKGRYFY